MADRCIRRHVDKQDGQVVIRRVTAVPSMNVPAPRQVAEAAVKQQAPRREQHRITRMLRQAVSR
jgi:hypothetical protein